MCSVVFLMSHIVIGKNYIVKKVQGINGTLVFSYDSLFKTYKYWDKKEIYTCNF